MHDSEEAQTAVRRRISVSWFKWRKLNSLLSNKAIQLKHHAKAINACIKSTMTYGAATWAITQREESLLHSCNRRMLRKMCGLSLTDRLPSTDIQRRCGFEDLLLTVRRCRRAWFGSSSRFASGWSQHAAPTGRRTLRGADGSIRPPSRSTPPKSLVCR